MSSLTKEMHTRITQARQAVNEGRFDDARALCRAVFEEDTGNLGALQVYVSVTKMTHEDAVFQRLEQFSKAENVPDPAMSQVHFMLGKAQDDIGDYDRAFQAFLTANRLKPVMFDARHKSAFADRLINMITKAPRFSLRAKPPRLVFILGMPRTGSTLLTQMLDAHPGVTSLGEVEALAPALTFLNGAQVRLADFIAGMTDASLATARARYLHDIDAQVRASGHVLVDKMPENYWLAWAIPMLFPEARIIHMQRDKRAVCWSCFRNDFGRGHEYSYDWQALNSQFDAHLRMVTAWKARDPDHWHDVALEDLTKTPQEALMPVLKAVDLPWDAACLTPATTGGNVKTLSKWQVRRGIDPSMPEGWRAYLPMIEAEWGAG